MGDFPIPRWSVESDWSELWTRGPSEQLALRLGDWIVGRRWFKHRPERFRQILIEDVLRASATPDHALWVCKIEWPDGSAQRYVLFVSLIHGSELEKVQSARPSAILASLKVGESDHLLVDGVDSTCGAQPLLALLQQPLGAWGRGSTLGFPRSGLLNCWLDQPVQARLIQAEQSNSTIVFGKQFAVKFYRQLHFGVHPELEIAECLAQQAELPVAQLLGSLKYRSSVGDEGLLAIAHQFCSNQGTAWDYFLAHLDEFIDEVESGALLPSDAKRSAPFHSAVDAAQKLGSRTAQLHLALFKCNHLPGFTAVVLSTERRREMCEGATSLSRSTFALLAQLVPTLSFQLAAEVSALMTRTSEIEEQLSRFAEMEYDAVAIRCHGDLHLGQVLCAEDKFVIIDFEGEPSRSLDERRQLTSPLRDVMGMMRSFSYVAETSLQRRLERPGVSRKESQALSSLVADWESQVSSGFLESYLAATEGQPFVPQSSGDIECLLHFFAIEKALYEISYELNHRPEWLAIPVRGLNQLLNLRFSAPGSNFQMRGPIGDGE